MKTLRCKQTVQLQNSAPMEQELVVSDTGCTNSMRKNFRTQTSIYRTLIYRRYKLPSTAQELRMSHVSNELISMVLNLLTIPF